MEEQKEAAPLVLKLVLYVVGTALGLAANLASLNRKNKLTWAEGLFHATVAFGCAWIVYFVLNRAGYDEWGIAASVIVGRFGDSIMIAISKSIIQTILNLVKKD